MKSSISSFSLYTQRLLLRPIQEEDAQGMYELNQAEDVYRLTGDKAFQDIEEVIRFIRNYDQFEKYKMGRFTVIDTERGKYAGWCGLKYDETIKTVDLGYRILPEFRRKGIASEAAKKCLQYGFEELSLEKIIGRTTKENVASLSILNKIGMSFEKEFSAHDSICEQYYITKDEWENKNN